MREIKGFDDYYIDRNGKVYSKKTGKLKELSPFLDSQNRYLMIRIIGNDGMRKTKLIHRLVAEAYLPNPKSLPEINHKDKNTQNPKLENLEWCTRKENLYDSYKTMSSNRNYKMCKLMKGDVEIGEFRGIEKAAKYAEETYGVSKASLSKYLSCGEFEIKMCNNTSRKTVHHKKEVKRCRVNLYKEELFLGEFCNITKAYQYIYDHYSIKISKTKREKRYIIKGFTIERIENKPECNDYPI